MPGHSVADGADRRTPRKPCALCPSRCTRRVACRLLQGEAMPVMNTDIVPVTEIMTRATVTSRADASIDSLIALMTQHHIGCIPIVDEQDRPTGIVTKLDLIECRDEPRTTAREIMMPHAMTVNAEDSVARAASVMSAEQIHHLLVVDSNRVLLGVVSTFDITRWLASQ